MIHKGKIFAHGRGLHQVDFFSLLFWFMALHSFFVGCALILHPPGIMHVFGFHPVGEEFFPAQGGIFHILMSILYLFVALRMEGFKILVYFSFIIKSSAFVFLSVYYLFIDGIPLVLLSGLVDGAMAIALILVYHAYRKEESTSKAKIHEKEQKSDDFWYY